MPRLIELVPEHLRARVVPITSATVLAAGLLFLALDVPLSNVPAIELEHRVWLQIALLIGGCLALLAKRRAPMTVLAAAAALFVADFLLGGSIGLLLVLVDAIYAAALHTTDRGRRLLGWLVAAATLGGTALTLAMTGDIRLTAFAALQLVAVIITPYWWGLAVQGARAAAALQAQRADDLERLAALTQQDAVREERGRMARDLHDAIASELSAIAIHTEAALAAPAPPRSSLETIRTASIRSLEQMRSMILVLRSGGDAPAAPDRLSDAAGIVARARERGLEVQLRGTMPAVPVATDQAAGRILQESLTNAMKHAPGSPVEVAMGEHGGMLSLRIVSVGATLHGSGADAATAVTAPPSAGLGVRMMRERAEALGGTLDAGPETSTGGSAAWTVRATLPLQA